MTKEEFLNSDLLKLPIVWRGKYDSFFTAVQEIGKNYLEQLSYIAKEEFENNGIPIEEFKKDELLTLAQNVLKSVIECLKVYLEEGNPNKSYQMFHESFTIERKTNKKEAPVFSLEFDKLYHVSYRVRKSLSLINNVKDIFHVPFQERLKIKSDRYSIPGYPTLYLANSLYVAFMELGEFDFDNVYVSKFIYKNGNQGKQYPDLLNLRNESFLTQDRFLARWPLVMACSLKVAFPEWDFKPEYIIPQIILQWTRDRIKIGADKKRIIGVSYSSSKIPTHKKGYYGEFYNLAIPVERAFEQGYCNKLKDLFELTIPISFTEALNANIQAEQEGQVKSIVDLWSNEVEYIKTGFGKVETALNREPYNKLYSIE
jgi:hypothetical protein